MKILELLFGDNALKRLFNALFAHTEGEHASEEITELTGTETVAVYDGETHKHAPVSVLGGGLPYKEIAGSIAFLDNGIDNQTVHHSDVGDLIFERTSAGMYRSTAAMGLDGHTVINYPRLFVRGFNANEEPIGIIALAQIATGDHAGKLVFRFVEADGLNDVDPDSSGAAAVEFTYRVRFYQPPA